MPTPHCIECRTAENLTDRCRRCAEPVCMEHVPLGGRRCAACELVYLERRGRIRTRVWAALGFALPWPLYLALLPSIPEAGSGGMRAITTGIPKLDFLIMTLVASYALGRGVAALRLAAARRRFLAEAHE